MKKTDTEPANLLQRKLTVVNIRRGKGNRKRNVYADLKDVETGELLIGATMDYITMRLLVEAANS